MKLSQRDKETIVAEIQAQKATMTELAKRYGVTIAAIGYVFKKATGSASSHQLTQSDRDAIVAALQSGKTTEKALAATYGVALQTIGRVYKRETGKPWQAKLSQTEKQAIVTELQSGNVTIRGLAKTYGVNPDTISRTFTRLTGAPLHPARRRLSGSERETLVRDLQSGKTLEELANAYGISPQSVRYHYNKATVRAIRHKRKRLTQQEKETILAMLQANSATMTDVANAYGVDQTAISHLFKRNTGKALRPHISAPEKKALVGDLLAGKVTALDVAQKLGIQKATVGAIFKRAVGRPLRTYWQTVQDIPEASRLRAWHREEKKMYTVYGCDWFNQQVLIPTDAGPQWQPAEHFHLMRYSGLHDKKRTQEFPTGQRIFAGDILQFPIRLQQPDGERHWTIVTDIVTYDEDTGWFLLPDMDGDPLCLHNDEAEVIGNIYANPEMGTKTIGAPA